MHRQHFFRDSERLEILVDSLLRIAKDRNWDLLAWAVFSNHYHVVARAPETENALSSLIKHVHSETSRRLNELDQTKGRKVWYQYWDKCLTFSASYYARLQYVMQNPVRHGLVKRAEDYPFCSAGWFEQTASSAFQRKVRSFKHDRVQEADEYDPIWSAAV